MNPVHPWLDADEVKRLSEQLLSRPATQNIPALESAAFGSDFVGFTDSPDTLPPAPLPLAGPAPQTVPAPAILPAAASLPASAPATVPQTTTQLSDSRFPSLLERIGSFCETMHNRFAARDLFLLDHAGDLIFNEGTEGTFHFVARSFALAPQGPDTATRHVHLRTGTGSFLEIIAVDTPMGCLVLGAVVPETLGMDSVQLIRQELLHAIHP